MSTEQKHYFDELINYASQKPNAKTDEERYHISVGNGAGEFLKLKIRRGKTFACFTNENRKSQVIKETDVSIKAKDTEIKIIDTKSLEAAKFMINVKVKQFSGKKTK